LIHLARKRRQLARERGDEFIPLDNGTAAGQGKKSSRLIRFVDFNLLLWSVAFGGVFGLLSCFRIPAVLHAVCNEHKTIEHRMPEVWRISYSKCSAETLVVTV